MVKLGLCRLSLWMVVFVGLGLAHLPQASAQDWSWSAGPRVGLSYSSLNAAPDTSGMGSVGASSSAGEEGAMTIPMPDLAGFGGGGGLAAELLFRRVIGVEVGLQIVRAHGTGSQSIDVGQGSTEVDYELTSTEVHLPVLLKLQTRFDQISFAVGFGLIGVRQLDSEVESDPGLVPFVSDEQTDILATLTFGLRFLYGGVSVPIELRLSTAPDPEEPGERFELGSDGTLEVDPSWTGHAWLVTGFDWHGAF